MAKNIVEIIINAIDNTKSGLKSPVTNLESLGGALTKMSGFFKLGEAASAFFFEQLIQHSIESAAALEKMSEKTGISVESLSTLSYAAQQSEIDMDTLAIGLKKMSSSMVNAVEGNKVAQIAFRDVGVSSQFLKDNLNNQQAVMLKVADAFSHMQDGAIKSALAVQLFGRSGTEMIPFLDKGAAGIQALQDKAVSLGLQISGDTAQQALAFENSLKQAEDGVAGFGDRLITWLLPSLSSLAAEFASLFVKGQAIANIFDFMSETLKTLYTVVLLVWDSFEYLIKTIATLTAGLLAFVSAASGGWESIKGAAKGFSDQLKEDAKTFDNLNFSATQLATTLKKGFQTAGTGDTDKLTESLKKQTEAWKKANPGMVEYFSEMSKLSKQSQGDITNLTLGAIAALGKAIDTDLSKSLTGFVEGTESFSQAANQLFTSLLDSMISYVAQLVAAAAAQKVMSALGIAAMSGNTAASSAAAAVVGGAWATPAALVSLASFGSNAGPADAAITTTLGLTKSMAGYETGSDYIRQTGPAILHAGERVVPAKTNQDLTSALSGGGGGGVVHAHLHIGNTELASAILNLQRLNMIPGANG